MDKIDPYKNELLAGVSAVVVGLLTKKILKKELVPVSDGRKCWRHFCLFLYVLVLERNWTDKSGNIKDASQTMK